MSNICAFDTVSSILMVCDSSKYGALIESCDNEYLKCINTKILASYQEH